MLLRHTPTEITERTALTINPAKTCQPIGAMYAALGVHNCLPHSHGSQGCCSYHRSTLTRHYKEPVMAATSSFTEGSSVFGGQANLVQAITTIFTVYNPDIIAVHTTCLSETIGDDCNQIIKKAADDGKIPAGKYAVSCATPSYVGSHVTGFANMVTSFVKKFSVSTGTKVRQVNILPGWVEPSDMREMKRIAEMMGINYVMLPDTSDVLDAPQTGTHEMYPSGGTTLAEIQSMGDSRRTVSCGTWASRDAARALDAQCKVPYTETDIPIGIKATDRYVQALAHAAGVPVPDTLTVERGRLIDVVTDMQQYFYGKRVALFGDPDQLIPLTEFLVSIGMKPVYIVSGTPGTREFEKRMHSILDEKVPDAKFKNGQCADMFLMHQWIKQESVDLLIGNTYGKYIARDENIPFVRHGFPIVDRIGHSYFPSVGYMGGLRLLEKILGVMLDKKDAEATESKFELVL
jgi:nitrogenase molybdenum-iron protein beta chain